MFFSEWADEWLKKEDINEKEILLAFCGEIVFNIIKYQ